MRCPTLLLIACGFLLIGCGGSGTVDPSGSGISRLRKDPAAVERATKALSEGTPAKVRTALNDFGFALFGRVLKSEPANNVTVSPASLYLAMGMAYNGAGGETQKAMAKSLGIEGVAPQDLNPANKDISTSLAGGDAGVLLEIANSVWAYQGVDFESAFLGRLKDFYGATAQSLDFSAPESVKTINDWVHLATHERIPTIIDRIDADTVMFLINAVYFKGDWMDPFKKDLTENRDFHLSDAKTKSHPFMTRRGDYDFYAGEGMRIVRLPFGKGRLGMIFLLPDENTSRAEFEKKLTAKKWAEWTAKMLQTTGTVVLPKFKLEYETDLTETLKSMGMALAFDPEKADFSAMRSQKDLFLQSVIHKTFVQIDEQGAEAAAVTGLAVGATAAPPPMKEFQFVADRPFYFAIQDRSTGIVLFLGSMADPAWPQEPQVP
ncbi:MAG: serpin family protein [Fimbriimonadaceae bacterium]|nr:MAG: serpin family protein [Fimbriimonadaceae bacterium]